MTSDGDVQSVLDSMEPPEKARKLETNIPHGSDPAEPLGDLDSMEPPEKARKLETNTPHGSDLAEPPGEVRGFGFDEQELAKMKEERLQCIFNEMDSQMRDWCKQLAARKCEGTPWRNTGESKLKVLSSPALDAQSFQGEYIAPGATFGVKEMRAEGSRKDTNWLHLVRGGWVLDHSRRAGLENKQVATQLDQFPEMLSDSALGIPNEDRRDAYIRMVHRQCEAELRMPEELKVDLMPYQIEGVEWLISLYNNELGGLLADEMGLGKTIQTVALLAFLKETKKRYGPNLIICPKSVVGHWKNEIGRCWPDYKDHLLVFQGTPAERDVLAKKIRKTIKKDRKKLIVITNYEQVHPDRNTVLQEPLWEVIVVDEGHRMKNQKSVFHQTMKEHIKGRMKLLLTGTPLQNNLDELFSLLHYLLPEIFTSASSFKSWFAAPFLSKLEALNMNEYFLAFTESEERLLIANLHAMLAPFVLQRTKADVMSLAELPPRKEVTIRVPLSAWQEHAYDEIKCSVLRRIDESNEEVSHQMLRNTTMQLRKISLHPFLFGRAAMQLETERSQAEDIARVSGKVETLDRVLKKMYRGGHKVLIFSQFTSMLDLLEDLLVLRKWHFERIDGQVPAEERQARISRFSETDGKAFIFLLSSKAGAVGLNLQAADTVILFDLDWNPQNDKQAIARAHRYGQTRNVLVVRLLASCPIEQHMETKAQEKLELEKKIIGAGGFSKSGNTKSPEERATQLMELFGGSAGTDAIKAKDGMLPPTSLQDANIALARDQHEVTMFEEIDKECNLEVANDADVSSVLVSSGRLMRPADVPDGFALAGDNSDSE